jgi:hypothetical protein
MAQYVDPEGKTYTAEPSTDGTCIILTCPMGTITVYSADIGGLIMMLTRANEAAKRIRFPKYASKRKPTENSDV